MSDILAVDVGGTVTNVLDRSLNIGVKLIAFLAIFFIGWLISRALYRLADRLLDRVGFNRLAERSGLRRWTGSYRPSDLIAKIVYYALLLFTLQLAFSVFGANAISDMLNSIVAWLPKLFVACIIVVVAAAVANAVFDLIHNALGALSYGRMLARAAQIAILALGVIAALNQIGVATTITMPVLIAALATIAGIAIVGIGGGLVRPMTSRWERILNQAESEGTKVAEHMRSRGTRRESSAFGQPSYQSRTGGQAAQDVQQAADRAAQQARDSAQESAEHGHMPGA
jgi:hypothetical protein